MCTIEARTPVDSRYLTTPPADANVYANDFVAINKYCDRVRFMTYDQQNVDVKLAKANTGLYAPIADPAWITKVIALAKKDIKASKIELGVATYGYINQVIPNGDGSGFTYSLIQSFNPKYGTQEAALYGITPRRNSVGEIGFSYVPASTSPSLPTQAILAALAPRGTPSALLAAEGAKAYLKSTGKQAVFQYLTWSDASAIASKIALAKKLGLRGVSVFKFDGGEDPLMWGVLK
jgi:spore germination protein YaaH